MNQFPSSQSVPSANPERLFFALWIIFSVLTALADIIAIVRHPEMTLQILPQTALGLAVCLPFGAVAILLRLHEHLYVDAADRAASSGRQFGGESEALGLGVAAILQARIEAFAQSA